MIQINIDHFIKKQITKREESLFLEDILENKSSLIRGIRNTSVLVIGGGGTIGASFIRALLEFKPSRLYVVDSNENALTELTRDLRSAPNQYVPKDFKTYPMNFSDDVFHKMLINEGPFDIVANFAAYKHVRSEKDHYSIEAMLENNVFRAKNLLDILNEHPPSHFFCVSTDKAANPVNVMGASKKLMEDVIFAYSRHLKITTARFANVAFSNGCLLDGYMYRLMKGQPISCPSDVKRFFVSPEESGQICLLACILGKSGEIFFPKLAEHELVLFKDITLHFFEELAIPVVECNSAEEARTLAASYLPGKPYPVYFSPSDTSGEKLYEEFYTESDEVDLSTYTGMGVIKNAVRPTMKRVTLCLEELKSLCSSGQYDKSSIIGLMKKFLPVFDHIEKGKGLDDIM